MDVIEATTKRITELCKEKNLSIYALAKKSNLPPSTVYGILKENRRDIYVDLIKKLCDGFNISLIDFFDSEIFNKIDRIIK